MARPKSLPPFQVMDVSTMDRESVTARIMELHMRFSAMDRTKVAHQKAIADVDLMTRALREAYARATELM